MPKKDDPKKDDISSEDLEKKIKEAQKASEVRNQESEIKEQNKEDSQSKINELTDSLQRAMADMQNMKRRAQEDKMRWVKFANYELLKQILPIVDNFDRACTQVPDKLKEDGWTKGVVQTHDELMKALEQTGVERIKTVGEKMDPTIHEAVMQDEGEKDMILEEFEPGYTYHGETLKAAKVKVGKGE